MVETLRAAASQLPVERFPIEEDVEKPAALKEDIKGAVRGLSKALSDDERRLEALQSERESIGASRDAVGMKIRYLLCRVEGLLGQYGDLDAEHATLALIEQRLQAGIDQEKDNLDLATRKARVAVRALGKEERTKRRGLVGIGAINEEMVKSQNDQLRAQAIAMQAVVRLCDKLSADKAAQMRDAERDRDEDESELKKLQSQRPESMSVRRKVAEAARKRDEEIQLRSEIEALKLVVERCRTAMEAADIQREAASRKHDEIIGLAAQLDTEVIAETAAAFVDGIYTTLAPSGGVAEEDAAETRSSTDLGEVAELEVGHEESDDFGFERADVEDPDGERPRCEHPGSEQREALLL